MGFEGMPKPAEKDPESEALDRAENAIYRVLRQSPSAMEYVNKVTPGPDVSGDRGKIVRAFGGVRRVLNMSGNLDEFKQKLRKMNWESYAIQIDEENTIVDDESIKKYFELKLRKSIE